MKKPWIVSKNPRKTSILSTQFPIWGMVLFEYTNFSTASLHGIRSGPPGGQIWPPISWQPKPLFWGFRPFWTPFYPPARTPFTPKNRWNKHSKTSIFMLSLCFTGSMGPCIAHNNQSEYIYRAQWHCKTPPILDDSWGFIRHFASFPYKIYSSLQDLWVLALRKPTPNENI